MIPRQGSIVSYWKGGLNQSGTLEDHWLVGGSNDGTLQSAPVQTETPYGPGLDYVSADPDYVDIANESNFDFERTNTFSVFAIIKRDTSGMVFAKNAGSGDFEGYNLSVITGGQVRVLLANDTGVSALVTDSDLATPAGVWTHIGFTYSGGSAASGLHIYINGKRVADTAAQDHLSATILTDYTPRIGTRELITNAPFDGTILETIVYNVELNPNEVKQLFRSMNRLLARRF